MGIKVLSELGCADNKALLLELPRHLLDGLHVSPDGTINTNELLSILLLAEHERETQAYDIMITEALNLKEDDESDEEISFEERALMMRTIFDPDYAVDISYSSPLKQRRRQNQ